MTAGELAEQEAFDLVEAEDAQKAALSAKAESSAEGRRRNPLHKRRAARRKR